jgi:hypothetical protein
MENRTVNRDLGSVIDKAAVRDVLVRLVDGRWFSEGPLGIEQATNRICSLQRPPADLEEAVLTVDCPYCGRTAGNRCKDRQQQNDQRAHPSRVKQIWADQ